LLGDPGLHGGFPCHTWLHPAWKSRPGYLGAVWCPEYQSRRFCDGAASCTDVDTAIESKAELAEPPSRTQLRMLLLSSALPFVGFGFLDNFLMILFGELIDGTLCVMFSFSTMAAAAIGNTISDVAGIFSGGAVEQLAGRMGVHEPPLEREQRQLRVTRLWQYTGQCMGIVLGCTLGCCPLLWMDPKEAERLRREKEREEVFESVIIKVGKILAAEAVALLLFDKEREHLFSAHVSPNLPPRFRWPKNAGFIGHVAQTGQFVNIADIQEEPLYDPALHDNLVGSGIRVQSILCMPIFLAGRVHGVIVVFNKSGGGAFTFNDEDILSAICSHISVASAPSKNTFEEVIENCERSMSTTGSPEWSTSGASRKMSNLFAPALEGIRNVLGAEATALMLLDHKNEQLYTEVIDGPLQPHRTRIGVGIAGEAVQTGKILNVGQSSKRSWFRPERHLHYQGSNIDVRSELVVPLFDTSKKCLGAIKCINKMDAPIFGKEDVAYAMEVAHHIGMMLEGPDAGLRRVLALSRRRMQERGVIVGIGHHQRGVLCYLEKAQNLPSRGERKATLDPYLTFSIVRGNPLLVQQPGAQQRQWRYREKDRRSPVRRFAKSNTILRDANPTWNERMAVAMPAKFHETSIEELFVHVLLWDYDTLSQDDLVAQAVVPLADIPCEEGRVRPLSLQPLPGQEGVYDLDQAKIWVSFTSST